MKKVIFLSYLSLIFTGLLGAFFLTYLWQWFVVPFGLPGIGVVQAYGLLVIAGLATFKTSKYVKKSESEEMKELYYSTIQRVVAIVSLFVFGWVASLCL